MAHPLTDEICDQIQDSIHPCDPENMRAAYDRGRDDQLEKVINWIEDEGFYDHITYDLDYGVQTYESGFIAKLKKAMRPQQ